MSKRLQMSAVLIALILLLTCVFPAAGMAATALPEDYSLVVQLYQLILDNGLYASMTEKELLEDGLCPLLKDLTKEEAQNFGYVLEDINGDGTPELFLGVNNEEYNETVFQILTEIGGEVVCLYTSSDDDAVYLLSDGQLRYDMMYDNGNYGICLYRMNADGSVTVTDGVLFDQNAAKGPYFSMTDDSFNAASGKAISEAVLDRKISDYMAKERYLYYLPLSSWDGGSSTSLTGIGGNAGSSKKTNVSVNPQTAGSRKTANATFTMQTLRDPATGVKAAYVLVPDSWNASMKVDWEYIDVVCPGVASVNLISPDGKAMIHLESSSHYVDMYINGVQQRQGADLSNYITKIPYHRAEDMQTYYFDIAVNTNYRQVESFPVPDSVIQVLQEGARILMQNTARNTNNTADGCEGTAAHKLYQSGDQYVERITLESAYQISGDAGHVKTTTISWTIFLDEYLVTESKQAYEQYRDIFRQVCANSSFTSELLYVNQIYGQGISNLISQGRIDSIRQYLNANVGFWTSEYEKMSDSSDRFINGWSDVIKDQNEYTTLEGEKIKVSTAYDTVYQNGDSFYFGPEGQSPYGWTRLYSN